MLIEGKVTLKAPIQSLWDSILKPDILASCVPGVESLELKGNNLYEGVIKQKVGPFSVTMKGSVEMVELVPPTHLKGKIKGEAFAKMGTVMGEMIVDFKEIQKDEVELTYSANVNITGKLATFGDRIMSAKAKDMEKEVTKNFQEKLI